MDRVSVREEVRRIRFGEVMERYQSGRLFRLPCCANRLMSPDRDNGRKQKRPSKPDRFRDPNCAPVSLTVASGPFSRPVDRRVHRVRRNREFRDATTVRKSGTLRPPDCRWAICTFSRSA